MISRRVLQGNALWGAALVLLASTTFVDSSHASKSLPHDAERSTASADAVAIARDLGLAPEVVEDQLVFQDRMDLINFTDLDQGYAEVSSKIDDQFSLTYMSRDEPPETVTRALEEQGLLAMTTFERVPHSASELAVAHRAARDALGTTLADSYDDVANGSVILITEKAPSDALRGRTQEAAGDVNVEWTIGPLATPSVGGGGDITGCTSGFVVKNLDNGNRGIATAGHCDDPQYLSGVGSLNFKAEHYYGIGDYQWHDKAGVTWDARVYDGSGSRDITGRKNYSGMNIGDQVVKYGVATGFTTGTIVTKTWCPTYVDACEPIFPVAEKNGSGVMNGGGDSGGPVMLNNVAYGFVSGIPGSMPNGMIFGAQQFTWNGLNVQVLTQ